MRLAFIIIIVVSTNKLVHALVILDATVLICLHGKDFGPVDTVCVFLPTLDLLTHLGIGGTFKQYSSW